MFCVIARISPVATSTLTSACAAPDRSPTGSCLRTVSTDFFCSFESIEVRIRRPPRRSVSCRSSGVVPKRSSLSTALSTYVQKYARSPAAEQPLGSTFSLRSSPSSFAFASSAEVMKPYSAIFSSTRLRRSMTASGFRCGLYRAGLRTIPARVAACAIERSAASMSQYWRAAA